MADLLECLLQIKGLRETLPRLNAMLAQPAGAGVHNEMRARLAEMLRAEAGWQHFLRAALPVDSTRLLECPEPAGSTSDDLPACFGRARRSTLALLDACTATELAATATLRGRHRVSVADLVATMLSVDTEHLGEMRRLSGVVERSERS
jgi:hypothetical protein